MGLFDLYQNSPTFAEETDVHVTDGMEILRENGRILSMLAQRGRDVTQGLTENRVELVNENPLRFAGMGFQYRTGMTTLAFVVDVTSVGVSITPRFRVYVNGTMRIDSVISATGVQTFSVATVAAWGLTDGQVAEVDIQIHDPSAPSPTLNESGRSWGRYYLIDAYVTPVAATLTDPWPGVPTFTTGPATASMAQLGRAYDWMAARMALVPDPVWMRPGGVPGLYWPTTYHLWSGGTVARGEYDRLRVELAYQIVTNGSERIRLLINGTEVQTSPTYAAPTWGVLDWTISLTGYGASTPLRLELQSIVTGESSRPSRFTVHGISLERSAPTFVATPTAIASEESMAWSTARTRLTTYASAVSGVKAQIDAFPDRWDRARLFRRTYAYNDGAAQYLQFRYQAVQRRRVGSRLLVRGSGIRIGWGPFVIEPNREQDGEPTLKWAYEETITAADKVETREIALSGLPGLDVGSSYALIGWDLRYAAEFLR